MAFLFGIAPIGFKEAEKVLAGIKDGYPKAASEAINRGLLAGRTAAAKSITARYAITSANVKAGFETKPASWSKLEGSLTATGPMMKVAAFHTNIKDRGKGKHDVYATIIKGNKKLIKNAFVLSGGRIMERRQPEKYPVFPVMTIGVPSMASHTGVSSTIQDTMNKATAARLKHNVTYALERLQSRSAKTRMVANTKLQPSEVQAKML